MNLGSIKVRVCLSFFWKLFSEIWLLVFCELKLRVEDSRWQKSVDDKDRFREIQKASFCKVLTRHPRSIVPSSIISKPKYLSQRDQRCQVRPAPALSQISFNGVSRRHQRLDNSISFLLIGNEFFACSFVLFLNVFLLKECWEGQPNLWPPFYYA